MQRCNRAWLLWSFTVTSPRYLEMIEQKFGPETVSHIKDMTAHRLVRRFVPSGEAVHTTR